jgi:hypothetical protein
VVKPKAEYTVTLSEQPMTQEEISAKYVENSKKYLQQQIDFYKKLNQLKRNEMAPSEKLHLDAAAYATNRGNLYLEVAKEGIAIKRTPVQMQGIWLAHYEGYVAGYKARAGK